MGFGRHSLNDCVPHVLNTADSWGIGRIIPYVLLPEFDHEQAGREGTCCLSAIKAASFDLRGCSHLHDKAYRLAKTDDAADDRRIAFITRTNDAEEA